MKLQKNSDIYVWNFRNSRSFPSHWEKTFKDVSLKSVEAESTYSNYSVKVKKKHVYCPLWSHKIWLENSQNSPGCSRGIRKRACSTNDTVLIYLMRLSEILDNQIDKKFLYTPSTFTINPIRSRFSSSKNSNNFKFENIL